MSADIVLTGARIWSRPDAELSEPTTVLMRDGHIAEIGAEPPAGTLSFDLGGRVLTAGFWNCHVHFTGSPWHRSKTDTADHLQPFIDDMLLARGFTNVLDLASSPKTTKSLIERIDTDDLRGPEIVTAGPGIRPWRGMPFYVAADVPRYLHWAMPGPSTPIGAATAVRMQAAAGAGITKLFTGSYVTPTDVKPMNVSVARAAVRAAHARGFRVFAHPSNREGTEVALLAGVDALAHLPDETEGTAALLREAADRGIRVVPTLHMFAATVTDDDTYLAPIREALRGFIAAGGRVLFGTDVGYMSTTDTGGEFAAMEQAGMDARAVLASLTTEPAEFMRRDDLGVVEVGRRANLTVLEADGAPAPADFASVYAAVRDGRVLYTSPSLPPE